MSTRYLHKGICYRAKGSPEKTAHKNEQILSIVIVAVAEIVVVVVVVVVVVIVYNSNSSSH